MSRIIERLKLHQKKLQWVGFAFCVGLYVYNKIFAFYFGIACLGIMVIYRTLNKNKVDTTGDEVIEPVKKGTVPIKKVKKKNQRK